MDVRWKNKNYVVFHIIPELFEEALLMEEKPIPYLVADHNKWGKYSYDEEVKDN